MQKIVVSSKEQKCSPALGTEYTTGEMFSNFQAFSSQVATFRLFQRMETTISEDVYLPGEKICQSTHARSGPGTYVRDGHIYASLIGKAKIEREVASKSGEKSNHASTLPTVTIKSLKDNSVVIPHIGSLVIAKVSCPSRLQLGPTS